MPTGEGRTQEQPFDSTNTPPVNPGQFKRRLSLQIGEGISPKTQRLSDRIANSA
jgi:hypothetical protein